MKKQLLFPAAFALSLAIVFTSCKKDNTRDGDTTIIAEQAATHTDDQSRFSSEIDAVANDADLALETSSGFAGRPGDIQGLICGATVNVDTTTDPRTITITYDGSNCAGNRTREGAVIISMPQGVHWKNAGAALTVTFQSLKITRVSDNKSITINGSQTYTNVSGGLLINILSLGTITHTITSDGLSVTFDDNSQRTWQVAKERIFTFSEGLVISTSGTHTEGNDNHVAEWGTNRFGKAFSSSTIEPIIVRQSCNARITSGAVKHSTAGFTATATFGLDASGNPTSCPGAGHYYYKLVWTGPNGNSASIILPY